MEPISVAVVGVGWIGGRRAEQCAEHPLVDGLYLAEIDEARAREMGEKTRARGWVTDHRQLLDEDVDAVLISSAPEETHFPIARDWLAAGRHVLLEKPMALTLAEADELIELADRNNVQLTIGYTQRFNPKFAYIKQCVLEGSLGRPVSALVSRQLTRTLGAKIAARGDLGPVQMEGTHDIDLVLWWMQPARPIRVYAQAADGVMREPFNLPDCVWTMVTMDNGTAFTIGSNWNLPPEAPGFSGTTIELIGTDGALFVDDSHRDVLLSTVEKGLIRPLSTMPGEQAGHVYAGAMENETRAFVDAVARDRPVVVTAREARQVMEVTVAADRSAETGRPIELPMRS